MGMSLFAVQSAQDGSSCTLPGGSSAVDKGEDASLPVKWVSLDMGT